MVSDVLPVVVTEDGEKTQAAPDGSPEQENVTVPVKSFEGDMEIVLGLVAWPFVTVSPPG